MPEMSAIDVNNFRENLKSLCDGYGEVKKLAEKAGISRPYLSDIMRGENTPSLAVAIDIAKAAGVDLADMLAPPKKFSKILAQAG